MRYTHGIRWFTAFLLLWCGSCPGEAAAERVVFAHFMLANQDYVSDSAPSEAVVKSYEREIRQAQAIGIDGFALNAGGWFREPRYIKRASEMFEAAYRLHSNFKLMFSADMCCSNDAEDVEDMVRRFANSRRYSGLYYKRDGRFLLTTFAGTKQGPAFWQQLRQDLEQGLRPSTSNAPSALRYVNGVSSSKPLAILLVPAFFWGGEVPRQPDIEAGLEQYRQIVDGDFYWGIAGVPGLGQPDQLPSSEAYASVLHQAGKLYIAPICFQFWGANAGRYYEYSGYGGMRAMWMNAINISHPEAVEIITWNDFIEGTYVSPIDDAASYPGANDLAASAAPPATLHYFHSHSGVAQLLAYFIQWYKSGVAPVIRRDSVSWAYRTVGDVHAEETPAIRLYGPVQNVLYLTANLKAPAVLHVSFGKDSRDLDLPAGSTDVQVPIAAGDAPLFQLTRDGTQLAMARGADATTLSAPYPNFYYSTGSMHD